MSADWLSGRHYGHVARQTSESAPAQSEFVAKRRLGAPCPYLRITLPVSSTSQKRLLVCTRRLADIGHADHNGGEVAGTRHWIQRRSRSLMMKRHIAFAALSHFEPYWPLHRTRHVELRHRPSCSSIQFFHHLFQAARSNLHLASVRLGKCRSPNAGTCAHCPQRYA